MPSGMAITAAIRVEAAVRYTVLTKSKPSAPPFMPCHKALKVAIGEGSSTGSTHCCHVASDQMATRAATPTTGKKGLRYSDLTPASPRVGTVRDNAPWCARIPDRTASHRYVAARRRPAQSRRHAPDAGTIAGRGRLEIRLLQDRATPAPWSCRCP